MIKVHYARRPISASYRQFRYYKIWVFFWCVPIFWKQISNAQFSEEGGDKDCAEW